MTAQTNLTERNQTGFYEAVADDVKREFIQFLSVAGHGKTSSLRTILQYCKKKHPDLVFKIFDVSVAWFHNAPVKYRQLVTREKLRAGKIANVCDCVYEIGSLSEEEQMYFVSEIVDRDYDYRYKMKIENPEELEKQPFIIYVWEEANIYFGSYSFRSNKPYTEIFKKVTSVGRNFRMRGFLIATAEVGEMSPSLRRRSKKIYGKIESESDLSKSRRRDKNREYQVTPKIMTMPKYHFLYDRGKDVYGPIQIPDAVNHVPEDYVIEPLVQQEPSQFNASWWIKFGAGAGITLLAIDWLLNYKW